MEVNLKLDKNMRIIGTNALGHETYFDTHTESGGDDSAPTPMEIALEAMGACGYLDVISIIRKKRKTVVDLKINLKAERANEHPKVITDVKMIIELISPDAELAELERAVQLSQETYCGVSNMFKRSGCNVTYECVLTRP
jgi:putative redox protein